MLPRSQYFTRDHEGALQGEDQIFVSEEPLFSPEECEEVIRLTELEGEGLPSSQSGKYKLGGDWVLAESKQVAKSCTPEDVLQAYLCGDNQKNNNPDKVKQCTIARTGPGIYSQEMVLLPQRVLSGMTTEMRYTQRIRVDRIGNFGFNAYVELDPVSKSTTKLKPFDVLKVNVSLKQVGEDVHIYACGLMRVNRKIVPNLYIFDASGIAGAMAGKGTLWLSSHFANHCNK